MTNFNGGMSQGSTDAEVAELALLASAGCSALVTRRHNHGRAQWCLQLM